MQPPAADTEITRILPVQPQQTLAIIPARAGSRGLHRKCALRLDGVPLLGRACMAATASGIVSRTILSTDDEDFARLGRQYGAETPYLRPAHLASDDASIIDVVCDLLDWLHLHEGWQPAQLVLLQPTSPFTTPEDVCAAHAMLMSEAADAIVSVCRSEVQPDWLRQINDDGYLEPIAGLAVPPHRPRQEMPITYRLNGAIYWIRREALLAHRTFLPPRTMAYPMAVERSIDIDTRWDYQLAQYVCASARNSDYVEAAS